MDSGLIGDLRRIVGSESVSTDDKDLERYNGDALGLYRAFRTASRLYAKPGAIVSPASAEQVSGILKFASARSIPVVPYGSGTGVMGGATPIEGCIVLSLQRMNAVLEVSKEDMSARAQPGVVLENLARKLKKSDLRLGHDPWSRPIASVGGAISTDGMGYTAAKHGSMGEQVLGLEVVLADGEIIRTKSVPHPTAGPSLGRLFIGSEGTLGVVTEATLRAFPRPEKRIILTIEFPDFETGFNAVAQLYREGVRPAMVDYGEEFLSEDNENDDGAALYLAFEGFEQDAETQCRKTIEICERFEGREGDRDEAQRFWDTRHDSGERYKRDVIGSDDPGKARRRRSSYRMDYLHVALPVSKVLDYRRRCQQIFESRRVLVREWSIWARPEFFSFMIVESEDEGRDTSESMADTVDRVLTLAQEMGGSMEYCHGVGIKLAHLMGGETNESASLLKRLKRSLDPSNILNPGKLVE
ncbi:MAG: FAD-binding oxidoreductase [Chloroflexi bacterium]|nr:FAD-binding oxidoreductase [Chloroflexota bacterium]